MMHDWNAYGDALLQRVGEYAKLNAGAALTYSARVLDAHAALSKSRVQSRDAQRRDGSNSSGRFRGSSVGFALQAQQRRAHQAVESSTVRGQGSGGVSRCLLE